LRLGGPGSPKARGFLKKKKIKILLLNFFYFFRFVLSIFFFLNHAPKVGRLTLPCLGADRSCSQHANGAIYLLVVPPPYDICQVVL
jgi:hypothetical protein